MIIMNIRPANAHALDSEKDFVRVYRQFHFQLPADRLSYSCIFDPVEFHITGRLRDGLGSLYDPDYYSQYYYRFAGTIEPNRKYAFRADNDFELPLPAVPWQAEDAQFVLYLTCLFNIDVTFPAGTLFIGGVPDTTQGIHKIIGTWNRNEGCWMIGSVTAEAAS